VSEINTAAVQCARRAVTGWQDGNPGRALLGRGEPSGQPTRPAPFRRMLNNPATGPFTFDRLVAAMPNRCARS